jgi:hypothetical protein
MFYFKKYRWARYLASHLPDGAMIYHVVFSIVDIFALTGNLLCNYYKLYNILYNI